MESDQILYLFEALDCKKCITYDIFSTRKPANRRTAGKKGHTTMNEQERKKLIDEIIDNLKNLDQVMAHLEQQQEGDLFSLIRQNLSSDMEKLEKLRNE